MRTFERGRLSSLTVVEDWSECLVIWFWRVLDSELGKGWKC